ncbi:MAG: CRISPR-associated endonuclease Cas2 [Xanthomonadales bacterium]|nr:CRISPR-associated endonuclease Cas2 [Xanthomonadales bacterium]
MVSRGAAASNTRIAPTRRADMRQRRLVLACYDVTRPSRLRAALAVSRRFATGGQKSVHECWVTRWERHELQHLLSLVIDPDADRVLLVHLDGQRRVITLGAALSPVDADCIVIGAPT